MHFKVWCPQMRNAIGSSVIVTIKSSIPPASLYTSEAQKGFDVLCCLVSRNWLSDLETDFLSFHNNTGCLYSALLRDLS